MQHCFYSDDVNVSEALKESAMSITRIISWVTAHHSAKAAETISYDALFKGTHGPGDTTSVPYLPGLRPVENEVDSYFREVFTHPIF